MTNENHYWKLSNGLSWTEKQINSKNENYMW